MPITVPDLEDMDTRASVQYDVLELRGSTLCLVAGRRCSFLFKTRVEPLRIAYDAIRFARAKRKFSSSDRRRST